jgi:hypothetical protein
MLGSSVSSFENQDVKTRLVISEKASSSNLYYTNEIGVGAGGEVDICAGLGIASCNLIVQGGASAALVSEGSSGTSISSSDEFAASIAFGFSYETSGEPDLAGHDSTMFLVPALNIVFTKSLLVKYDSKMCIAIGTEVTAWSLTPGGDNFEARYAASY